MVAEMIAAFAAGDYQAGVAMRGKVQGFADVIYANPVLDYRARCKVALAYLGVIDENETYVRSPLLAIESEESERINQALIAAGMK
jgi:dihydrodipicolinate synthase/N-acetylneuraminate lyase